jgi:L-asparaginase
LNNILMLSTGGTVAGNVAGAVHDDADSQDVLAQMLQPTLSSIRASWGATAVGHITQLAIDNVDSSDIVPAHWARLADEIKNRYDDIDGFIVTHGTNTMGYTCGALSFALPNLNKPVVVTGSQVPSGQPASDALMNLANAVRVAAYPYEGGVRGVVCVFGSHIISGVRVKKSTEFDLDAFQTSESLGRIGRIIQIHDDRLKRHHSYLTRGADPPALIRADLRLLNSFDQALLSLTEFPGLDPGVLNLDLAVAA